MAQSDDPAPPRRPAAFPVSLSAITAAGRAVAGPKGARSGAVNSGAVGASASPTGRVGARPIAHPASAADAHAPSPAAMVRGPALADAGQSARRRLVEQLRRTTGADERALAAFDAVPRHAFVDTGLVAQAYEDTSLPIGWGQTISKPGVVARMLSLLLQAPRPARRIIAGSQAGALARPLGRVLEIGTGCGYQTALLAMLAEDVTSIERIAGLHEKARATLAALGIQGHYLMLADGRDGCGWRGPYDTIIAAAGGQALPPAWLAQLADGGRLVAPVEADGGRGQHLVVVDRRGEGLERTLHDAVHFVPLESGVVSDVRNPWP